MKLILNNSEFEHVISGSFYNHNYYQHLKIRYVVLEICDEDYNTFSFYLIENGQKIFLGSSNNGFGLGNKTIEIDFKTEYT